jgi:hypothetical protein
MKTLIRSVIFPLAFLISASSFGQGYKLTFRIEGWKDTTAYLAYYWAEATYPKDTARVNSQGEFTFEGKTALQQGLYLLVVNKARIFDFVVGSNQHFTITTSSDDYMGKMKSTDQDNKLFLENLAIGSERHKLTKVIEDPAASPSDKDKAEKGIARLEKASFQFHEELLAKYPGTVTARVLKATKPLEIPDNRVKADGSIDSTFQLWWYREHYFDNFDLADDALIRLPSKMYHQKVNEYLDRLFVQHPDSLEIAIEKIITKAKKNPETYKYIVYLCMAKYQEHAIMGLDEIYVELYDKYFATGEMNFWTSEKLRKNIRDIADRMRRSLVGRIGANLIMQDVDLEPRAMYDIKNKYTILFIFDPDCGHCKQETPRLVSFYNRKKFDLEVYAVSLDSSMAKMRDMITKMNMKWITVNGPRSYVGPVERLYDAPMTPSLYILDRNKKIIAKKLPVAQVEEFLTRYEQIEKSRDTPRR